jgi:hypothetical protein
VVYRLKDAGEETKPLVKPNIFPAMFNRVSASVSHSHTRVFGCKCVPAVPLVRCSATAHSVYVRDVQGFLERRFAGISQR